MISVKMNDNPQIALVTGASSGIGKALSLELLARGYEVIGVSRSVEKLEKIRGELQNSRFSIVPCDVSDPAAVKEVSARIKEMGKIPSFFYLNAGIAGLDAIEPTDLLDLQVYQKIFSVNYYGVLNFVREWLQPCKENGGAAFIVSSSINAIFAPPGGSAYSASKAAISKTFDGLRLTHRNNNLKFLSIFCCPVDTPGLAGKLPFTWHAERMAKYMIQQAEKGIIHSNPSWFYTTLCKFLNRLPEKQVMRILRLLTE